MAQLKSACQRSRKPEFNLWDRHKKITMSTGYSQHPVDREILAVLSGQQLQPNRRAPGFTRDPVSKISAEKRLRKTREVDSGPTLVCIGTSALSRHTYYFLSDKNSRSTGARQGSTKRKTGGKCTWRLVEEAVHRTLTTALLLREGAFPPPSQVDWDPANQNNQRKVSKKIEGSINLIVE